MFKLRNIEKLNQAIKDNCKIEHVAQNLYGLELFLMGNNEDWKACCPFHTEKTPSFGIKTAKQVYHCFGCKEGGDIISFVQKMENCTYVDALLKLAEYAKLDISQYKADLTPAERVEHGLYERNAAVANRFNSSIDTERGAAWVKKRRLNTDVLNLYKVGYASGMPQEIDEHGLEFDWRGKWEDVITVPLMNEYGNITGFRNRLLNPNSNIKVIGPKQTHPLKQPQIYGLYQARKFVRSSGSLILVEGEVDVWQMVAHGYRNTAGMLGTKLNKEMVESLNTLAINQIIVLADNDEAGRLLSKKVAEEFVSGNIVVKIAQLSGDGKDPDEVLLARGTDPIDLALANAKYAFEYYIEREAENFNLDTNTGKIEFLNEVKDKIREASPLIKDMAIKVLSTLTATSYDVIQDFLLESNAETVDLHNTLGERIILKRMMQDEQFIGQALMAIRSDDFFMKKHRLVFDAIATLYRKQQDVNQDVVLVYLENAKVDSANATIRSIMSQDTDASSADYMITDIKDKATRRTVQERAKDAVLRLSNTKSDATEIIRDLSTAISKAVVNNGSRIVSVASVAMDRMQVVMDRVRNKNPIIGFNLGPEFHTLNMTLHGLQTKRYFVLAAPSGAGKTAFACVLAKRLAVDLNVPTLFCTFETGVETITDRIVSHISGIPSDAFLTGYVQANDIERIQDAVANVSASPLMITERGMIFEEFEAMVRHDVITRGTRVVILDYIQLMELSNARGISRHLEVGKISRGILELAKELDITIVALAQQNRESVKGNNASKEGVGDSYKIAQDADIYVVFREKTQEELQAEGPAKGNRLLMLDKNRHGKAGVKMNFNFDSDVMKFYEVKGTQVRQ